MAWMSSKSSRSSKFSAHPASNQIMNETDITSFFFLTFCGLLVAAAILVAWRGKSFFE